MLKIGDKATFYRKSYYPEYLGDCVRVFKNQTGFIYSIDEDVVVLSTEKDDGKRWMFGLNDFISSNPRETLIDFYLKLC